MEEWTKEVVLHKVQALLAKADSTPFTPEADAFRAKADELMVKFAISSYEVDMANATKPRTKPVVREFFIYKNDSPIKNELLNLAVSVARHARCMCVYQVRYDGTYLQVVGFPADTEYAEMLYTSLWLQLSTKLEPKPDPDLSFEDNVVMLLESGQSRKRIAELFGLEWSHPLGLKMSKIYKEKTGRSGDRPMPGQYMANFAIGYVEQVANRFWSMKKQQEGIVPGSAIVLSSRQDEVIAAYKEAFPRLGKARKNTRRTKFAANAYTKGSKAGREANLGYRKESDTREERQVEA